jgi:hypothetical protein
MAEEMIIDAFRSLSFFLLRCGGARCHEIFALG